MEQDTSKKEQEKEKKVYRYTVLGVILWDFLSIGALVYCTQAAYVPHRNGVCLMIFGNLFMGPLFLALKNIIKNPCFDTLLPLIFPLMGIAIMLEGFWVGWIR